MAKITTAEAAQRLIDAVDKISANDAWLEYLTFARRLRRYSPTNLMLIYVQCPIATQVAGFKAWQALGRQVRKGEHGIRILAPLTVNIVDEKTGEKRPRVVGFRDVAVFDVSQTDGADLPPAPPAPALLTGDHDGFDAIASYVTALGFTVERGDCHGANGYTDFLRKAVRVRDDVDTAQAVKTLAHEAAHATLHGAADFSCQGRAEVEAESVAFIVGDALGLDTSSYTAPYVAGWALQTRNADKPSREIRAALTRITETADAILDHIAKGT